MSSDMRDHYIFDLLTKINFQQGSILVGCVHLQVKVYTIISTDLVSILNVKTKLKSIFFKLRNGWFYNQKNINTLLNAIGMKTYIEVVVLGI